MQMLANAKNVLEDDNSCRRLYSYIYCTVGDYTRTYTATVGDYTCIYTALIGDHTRTYTALSETILVHILYCTLGDYIYSYI